MFFKIETTVCYLYVFLLSLGNPSQNVVEKKTQLTFLWHLCDNIFLQVSTYPMYFCTENVPPTSV